MLWHLRARIERGDRKMDDRDISARNYCYSRRARILACIRTGGGLLAQLLIWHSLLAERGRWYNWTPPPTPHGPFQCAVLNSIAVLWNSLAVLSTSLWEVEWARENVAQCLCGPVFANMIACCRKIAGAVQLILMPLQWPYFKSILTLWPCLTPTNITCCTMNPDLLLNTSLIIFCNHLEVKWTVISHWHYFFK